MCSAPASAQAYTITAETQDFDNWVQTNLPNTVAASILKTAPPQSFPTSNIKTVAQVQAATPGYSGYNSASIFPADLNAVGTSNISVTTPNNGYQWSARVDYYLGKNDRIDADAIRTHRTSEGIQSRPATNIPYYDISDYGNVDWTHTFSPRLLNEMSVNMIRPARRQRNVSNRGHPLYQRHRTAGIWHLGRRQLHPDHRRLARRDECDHQVAYAEVRL